MAKRVVTTEDAEYLIRPHNINASHHLWDAFSDIETETSARCIVQLCQRNNGWHPFTEEEIEAFYAEGGHINFRFNRLLSEGYVVKGEDGKYRVTHEFIANCFRSSPNW